MLLVKFQSQFRQNGNHWNRNTTLTGFITCVTPPKPRVKLLRRPGIGRRYYGKECRAHASNRRNTAPKFSLLPSVQWFGVAMAAFSSENLAASAAASQSIDGCPRCRNDTAGCSCRYLDSAMSLCCLWMPVRINICRPHDVSILIFKI